MKCEEVRPLVHDLLDGDLTPDQTKLIKAHIDQCDLCRLELEQYELTEALVRTTLQKPMPISDDLTDRIMQSLPPIKKKNRIFNWMKGHPGIAAAAIFAVVMFGSFLVLWDEDPNLMIKGTGFEQIVIEGNTVYVPEGSTVHGDLIVRGAQVQIDGYVDGNVIVIDGQLNTASLSNISGKISHVNQVVDWLWFKLNEIVRFFSK